ncbi:MAG: anaerobic ribonucleoside-triphosphate reductase [Crocinitomicaceae bacterium]|nr:anaerobic ribonucleoside-triphosphate reductase [Crocinitomicaceae bacterium]
MIRLTTNQINDKIAFIQNYIRAENAASGSTMDANANVSSKNIATMEAELNKDINVQVNRTLVYNKICELFGANLGNEYLRQIESHEIYVHDETSLKPYCASISMYPFLLDGLTKLGGESKAPEHLESFCGSFVNLVFAVSSQFAGALATVEFLLYFDHFAKKDFGKDYLKTHTKQINNHLQHVVYAVNQPAAARGYQSVFWNISIYDQFYYESMFGNFVFPDMTKPEWESVKKLQHYFMNWFNQERCKAVLTFPVVTAAMLVENGAPRDKEFSSMCAKELSEGNSFFIYQSESADSLASCCRLRNEMTDNTFSYSLGAGGVSTGSINVITLNMNRLVQDGRDLKTEVEKIQKYQVAFRKLVGEYEAANMLPVYSAGFISLEKQFLTIGINGMAEAAESLGIEVGNNSTYKNFVSGQLKIIFDSNKEAKKKFGYMFNTEFVPAENLGVKNANWDRKDGYFVPRDCYNSYFYVVEDDSINMLDKFVLHGKEIIQYLDGGSALHMNLESYASAEAFEKLLCIAAKTGCNYFCFNIKITICNQCSHIDKETKQSCVKCGSKNVDYATRVIGYLKRVTHFSSSRQKEHGLRHYHLSQDEKNERLIKQRAALLQENKESSTVS